MLAISAIEVLQAGLFSGWTKSRLISAFPHREGSQVDSKISFTEGPDLFNRMQNVVGFGFGYFFFSCVNIINLAELLVPSSYR